MNNGEGSPDDFLVIKLDEVLPIRMHTKHCEGPEQHARMCARDSVTGSATL